MEFQPLSIERPDSSKRCAHGAEKLWRKILRFFRDFARKKWPLRGSSPGYNGAHHHVTQEFSDGSSSAKPQDQRRAQAKANVETNTSPQEQLRAQGKAPAETNARP
jgi:hypothetical protein